MSLYLSTGNSTTELTPVQLREMLFQALGALGPRKRVLVVPPDQSRAHSRAGDITGYVYKYYGDKLKAVLPAIGTHSAMRPQA